MQWKTLAVALALSAQDVYGAPAEEKRQNSAALMRFECSKLIVERIDPLVQPGQAPSAHLVRISSNPNPFPFVSRGLKFQVLVKKYFTNLVTLASSSRRQFI